MKSYNNSLCLGIFPVEWSCSLLPKTGDLRNSGNLRPISQTCIFAKILENIVKARLLDYLLRCYPSTNMFFYQEDRHKRVYLK